jgi:hypothetical protein
LDYGKTGEASSQNHDLEYGMTGEAFLEEMYLSVFIAKLLLYYINRI